MKVTFLGTGAAFPDPDRNHTAILLTLSNGRNFLLDCGAGATHQLIRASVNPAEIDLVCLTHLHHDHTSDYANFVITGWMFDRQARPLLLGPKGTKHFTDHLFENGAFDSDIRARAYFPNRQANIQAIRPEVREIEPGVIYEDDDIRITADWVVHIPHEVSECFGFRIEADGKVLTFSGDTAPCDSILKLAQGADLLIHECTFPTAIIEHREKHGMFTAHTSPTRLGEIAKATGVKQLATTHFGVFERPNAVLNKVVKPHFPDIEIGPNLFDSMVEDIRKNYSGPLTLAKDLTRIDV